MTRNAPRPTRNDDIIIRLARIALTGRHGCAPAEKKADAPFELDLALGYPEPAAPLKDDFAARPDYAAVALRAAALFRRRRFRLIEPLATMIAERLLAEFPLSTVTVTIRKLEPVIALRLAHAEVEVSRRRENVRPSFDSSFPRQQESTISGRPARLDSRWRGNDERRGKRSRRREPVGAPSRRR